MKGDNTSLAAEDIEPLIRTIRGQKVILADDLARLYGVPTKRLNEQVKRNRERFPDDFMFQLSRAEAGAVLRSRSQNATLKRGGNVKHLPYAFTENGAVMSANILNSPRAVRMSVFVVRAFVKMRELLTSTSELAAELRKLEARLTARLDGHETAIFDGPPARHGHPQPAAPTTGATPTSDRISCATRRHAARQGQGVSRVAFLPAANSACPLRRPENRAPVRQISG